MEIIRRNYDDIPLSVNMSVDRFVHILNKDLSVFGDNGITINGINVSMVNKSETINTAKIILALRDRTNFILYQVFNKTNTEELSSNLLDSLELPVYIFSSNDGSLVEPGLIVADNVGNPYFLYNELSNKFSSTLENNNTHKLIPLTNGIWNDIKSNNVELDVLATALGKVTHYTFLDCNDARFKEYYKEVLTKMSFNAEAIEMIYNFINIPLVKVELQDNVAEFTSIMSVDNNKIRKAIWNDKINLGVLSINKRVSIINRLTKLIPVNNTLVELAENGEDVVSKGENFKVIKKYKVIKEKPIHVTTYDNLRVLIPSENKKNRKTFKEGYNHIKEKLNNTITNSEKSKLEIELINYTLDGIIKNNTFLDGYGENEAIKYIKDVNNTISKPLRKDYKKSLINSVKNKIQASMESKHFMEIVHLLNIRKVLGDK